MDFGDALVLHDGGDAATADRCVKCFASPPERMAAPGKCWVCHATHCLAFGELTWAVPLLHVLLSPPYKNT